MEDWNAYYALVKDIYNEFAHEYGHPTIEKLNSTHRRKLKSRYLVDKNFLRELQDNFIFIHENCTKNEFGDPLDFMNFVRSSTLLMARRINSEKRDD